MFWHHKSTHAQVCDSYIIMSKLCGNSSAHPPHASVPEISNAFAVCLEPIITHIYKFTRLSPNASIARGPAWTLFRSTWQNVD